MRGWLAGCIFTIVACGVAFAQQAEVAPIAVFPFELEDKSAGAGIIQPDERDKRYLAESTAEAKRMLAGSGRFTVVETPDVSGQPYGLRNCGGCEAAIGKGAGARFTLLGVVTRVNRTEHTMLIRILDTGTGKSVAQGFTDLRMGANYAWPRSVKWVMTNQLLKSR